MRSTSILVASVAKLRAPHSPSVSLLLHLVKVSSYAYLRYSPTRPPAVARPSACRGACGRRLGHPFHWLQATRVVELPNVALGRQRVWRPRRPVRFVSPAGLGSQGSLVGRHGVLPARVCSFVFVAVSHHRSATVGDSTKQHHIAACAYALGGAATGSWTPTTCAAERWVQREAVLARL